jgi:hypothetical protein
VFPLEEGVSVGFLQLFFPEVTGLQANGVWREGPTLHVRAATTRLHEQLRRDAWAAGTLVSPRTLLRLARATQPARK